MAATPQPRLRRGELATAAWGLALLVAMFAVKWYGVDNIPGRSPSVVTAVDAWNGLSVLRWAMLVTILLTLASVALHLSQGDHGSQTDTSLVVAVAATLVGAGLVYRVLIALPQAQAIVDQKLGALLGLGCALAMAVSAWRVRRVVRAAAQAPVIQHRRPRRDGPAPVGATAPGAAVSGPAARGPVAPAGASAPATPSDSDEAGSGGAAPLEPEAPAAAAPTGPASDPAEAPASDPTQSAPDTRATDPAVAQTPAGDPAPRRRRARTSRPRPT